MDAFLEKNGYLDFESSGRIYDFKSPLSANDYFSIVPESPLPPHTSPIIDEDTGMCIGYIGPSRGGVYDIYDIDGKFVTLHELPLESPLIDPFDIVFLGLFIFKSVKYGDNIIKIITKNGTTKSISVKIGDHIISSLKGRLKIGLSPKKIKFTTATAVHMREPGRYIPVYILEKAIRYGKRSKDIEGKSGMILKKYDIKIKRSRYDKYRNSYENKEYNLEVIVDESNWTITHFLYK